MAMVANNPAKAKELGIPQKVGQEFTQADKGMKFGKAPTKSRADLQKINSPKTLHGKSQLFKEGGQIMAKNQGITTAKMGKVKTAAPSRDGVASKGKTKGTQIKMKAAGKPLGMCGGGMSKGKK
jgi:hypothetical protein